MLAQQILLQGNFTDQEKNFYKKQNQISLFADEAKFCSEVCLKNITSERSLNQGEMQCIQNCSEKLFLTERLLRSYIPRRITKLTMKQMEERLNNPTDQYGTYFTH